MRKFKHTNGFITLLLMISVIQLSCKKQSDKNVNENKIQILNNTITLSEAQIQLANIKTATVNEGICSFNRLFTGVLKVNEESAATISSRTPGRITKLFIKNAGEPVNKGDALYIIYSEELLSAERQYFNLLSNNWNFNGRYEPSLAIENKLLLLGMLPSQIEKLKKDGKVLFEVTIYSPVKGVVGAINVSEGQYVTTGQTLFELADDRNLWVEAQVHPDELEFLKLGVQSDITVPDAGNMTLKSTINFISPSLEQGKNLTVIRSVIDNSNRKLHPGMLALMNIQSKMNRCVMVPASSVITDKNGSVVWIRNENGSFTGRNITVGLQSEDAVQVLSGLSNSEFVVTSGAYLLNSELILRKGSVEEVKSKI